MLGLSMAMTERVERFCSQCGRSLVPLNVPHLSSECIDCGKTVHYVRPAADGSSIQVDKGEQFTIPAGFIQISLDPTSRAKLFRPGLSHYVKQLFIGNHPKQPSEIVPFIQQTKEWADKLLKNSKRLSGLNLDEEHGAELAIERIKKDQQAQEWHAMTMGAFSEAVTDSINKEDTMKAAWSGYMLGTVRGLTIVTDPLFEQTLWRGYLANRVVYEAVAVASQTPGEAEAIKKLEPLFRKLDEATLHTWVESKLPIGPRIGVKALPEEILSALAKWHLASFQREREETARAASERRANWELRIKWLTLGVTATGALFTVLKLVGLV